MGHKSVKYYIKSGLVGGLIGGLNTYIFISILTLIDNYKLSYNNLVPLIFFVPLIIFLIDYDTFKKMAFGNTVYVFGFIISLFILMNAEIISMFWGWIYIIVSLVIILYKVGFLNFIWELIKGVKNARY